MTSRALYDRIGEYRAATARMTNSNATFTCGQCGKYSEILGRKLMKSPSRIKRYMCKMCAAEAV
jgi:transcription elongation factor Elf1